MTKGTLRNAADSHTHRVRRQLSSMNTDTDDLALTRALLELGNKSMKSRICALKSVNVVLSKNGLRKSALCQRRRICDAIESSLGHGIGDDEQELAAKLAPKLALQLGDSDTIVESLGPLMLRKASDKTVASFVRAQCSSSLALLYVMRHRNKVNNVGSTLRAMEAMVNIFGGANAKCADTEASHLHSAALNAWALLVSLIPAADFCLMVYEEMPAIPTMESFLQPLRSQHHKVREAAAKAIAVIFENGRRSERYFIDEHVSTVVNAIQPLIGCNSVDQGHTLYMVLRFVDECKQPEEMFDIEKAESKLLTWSNHLLISAFEHNLDTSITVHLNCNRFLKSVMHKY